jgi:hypothetical protein
MKISNGSISEYSRLVTAALLGVILWSCETIIDPKLSDAEPVLVVDAWLNNRSDNQVIILTNSQGYFNSSPLSEVSGASVEVLNITTGETLQFVEEENTGKYIWAPSEPGQTIGQVGDQFKLLVQVSGYSCEATSAMNRVPPIDSITFNFEPGNAIFPDGFVGECWANDLPGKGDAYWIKAWKNDTLLLKPAEINLAFDGGFSEGNNFDGVTFITPKRRGINPINTDADGNPLPSYLPGDSVYVEIHSLTRSAFNFLNEVVIQTNRPGGFSELFAAPVSNVGTNLTISGDGGSARVLGFFNVAAVSSAGKRLNQ